MESWRQSSDDQVVLEMGILADMAKREILQAAVGPTGEVFSLQTGGRIVRHGNPKKNDPRVEVVYEGRERLDGLWVSPSGALHAVGKHYHTNASGKWHKERVPVGDDLDILIAVWARSDDEVWVGSEEGEVFVRRAGNWKLERVTLPKDGNMIYSIRGTAKGDVYVTSDEGIAHFDGKKWQRAKMPDSCCYLDVLARDEGSALVVGRDGPNLFEGTGTRFKEVTGLSDDPSEDFYSIAARGKDVYIATGARLLVWDGKKCRDAIPAAGGGNYLSCMYVAANGGVVAATAHDGVYVCADKEWTHSPATAEASTKNATKKKATASKTSTTKNATKKKASTVSRSGRRPGPPR